MSIFIGAIAGLVLAVLLMIYFFRLRQKRQKKAKNNPLPVSFKSKLEFGSKLDIYVLSAKDETEIPPQTFDLFRLGFKRKTTLRDILKKCRMPNIFSGMEQVYFISGPQGSLRIVNHSDCTIMVGADILVKKLGRTLAYGDKIHITSKHGLSEIEVHYKSVKPS